MAMVAAQKRPRRSHLPSLNRLPGLSASGWAMSVTAPVSGSTALKPVCMAATRPPRRRGTTAPTSSGIGFEVNFPVTGSPETMAGARMSTQCSLLSDADQTGPSPRKQVLREHAIEIVAIRAEGPRVDVDGHGDLPCIARDAAGSFHDVAAEA
jgi:hypothetical protein